ncbi:hypothetical protein BC941DRAFT_461702 [Chlamydoabsidia padenii]|nr:hypothetical protein BC941DRAFT_461702 [Chlamydoabsidia padenii]
MNQVYQNLACTTSSPPIQEQQPQQPQQPQRQEPPKRRSMPPPIKPARPESSNTNATKTKPRSHSNAGTSSSRPQTTFNFAAAKPKIIQEIALANQHHNQLVNALKHLNTREDRWEIDLQHDKKLQEYRQECEESKKKIVKYARLVEDEEWIGTLLATNEELLKALDMYDIMSVGEVPANLFSSPLVISSPPQQQQIAYHNDPVDHLDQDLHGLQLIPRAPDNDNEEEDPFADPFADPVEPHHRQ